MIAPHQRLVQGLRRTKVGGSSPETLAQWWLLQGTPPGMAKKIEAAV